MFAERIIKMNKFPKISIQVNCNVYIKDPESSDLGKRIVSGSIQLISENGFESFTFLKLAKEIGTTEASVYRYFESKHKLLLYLMAWYWNWMEYRMLFGIANISSPYEKLDRCLDMLIEKVEQDGNFEHINEVQLNQIVIAESSKAYLTKEVDEENKHDLFLGFKELVQFVSDIILEINPDYKYPHMLISNVIEGAHHQRFFAEHLPRLTNQVEGEDAIAEFFKNMVYQSIKVKE